MAVAVSVKGTVVDMHNGGGYNNLYYAYRVGEHVEQVQVVVYSAKHSHGSYNFHGSIELVGGAAVDSMNDGKRWDINKSNIVLLSDNPENDVGTPESSNNKKQGGANPSATVAA